MNRIEPIIKDIQSETNVEDRMELIMYALNDTVTPIPEEEIFVLLNIMQKPRILNMINILVAVTEIFSWGFRGLNFHHGEYRQYTWEELGTQVYVVNRTELDDLVSLQYGKLVLNK